jgi:hypothetical protein
MTTTTTDNASALGLDVEIADEQLIANLVSCYGSRTAQPEAAALIARFHLRQAAAPLAALSHSRARGIRWGAIYTRERLEPVPRHDYVNALILDLDAPNCETRRRAADRLDRADSEPARAALARARVRDAAETPWYRKRCLGTSHTTAAKKPPARTS